MMSRGSWPSMATISSPGRTPARAAGRPGGHRHHSGQGHGASQDRRRRGRRSRPSWGAGRAIGPVRPEAPGNRGCGPRCCWPRRGGSAPVWRWRSRRWPGWCGCSSRRSTATTRSSTTRWWSSVSASSGWSSWTTSSEVPAGRPLMLSAHGSAPEVVDAARASGGAVVNAVCPLVTKVHHEVKVRAARATRSCTSATRATRRPWRRWRWLPRPCTGSRAWHEVEALPGAGRAGGLPGPDDPGGRRVAEHARGGQAPLARPVGAGPQRPVLRHHQPAGRPEGHRRSLRRDGRHRQRRTPPTPWRWCARLGPPAAPGCCGSTGRPSYPTTWPAWSGVIAGASAPESLVDEVLERLAPANGHRRGARRARGRVLPPPPGAEGGAAGSVAVALGAVAFAPPGTADDEPGARTTPLDGRDVPAAKVLATLG